MTNYLNENVNRYIINSYGLEVHNNEYDFNFVEIINGYINNRNVNQLDKFKITINNYCDVINNNYAKLRSYTNRATAGPQKCRSTISNNYKKIERKYIEIICYINSMVNLKLDFINFLIYILNNNQEDNNKYLALNLDKSNSLKENIRNNENIRNSYDNKINALLKEFNESYYYKYKQNKNFIIRFFKLMFNKQIKIEYKKYKTIWKNIKINKKEKMNVISKITNLNISLNQTNNIINTLNNNREKMEYNMAIFKEIKNKLESRRLKKEFVYIISNEEGIYKIGKTNSIEKRLKSLSTSVHRDFEIIKLFQCWNMSDVEIYLHKYFSENRINKNREFFKLTLYDINKIDNILKERFNNEVMLINKKVRY